MPRAKATKKTQEELFPHGGFPTVWRLRRTTGPSENRQIAWFQCEAHLVKHVTRYRITEGLVDVAEGSEPSPVTP